MATYINQRKASTTSSPTATTSAVMVSRHRVMIKNLEERSCWWLWHRLARRCTS